MCNSARARDYSIGIGRTARRLGEDVAVRPPPVFTSLHGYQRGLGQRGSRRGPDPPGHRPTRAAGDVAPRRHAADHRFLCVRRRHGAVRPPRLQPPDVGGRRLDDRPPVRRRGRRIRRAGISALRRARGHPRRDGRADGGARRHPAARLGCRIPLDPDHDGLPLGRRRHHRHPPAARLPRPAADRRLGPASVPLRGQPSFRGPGRCAHHGARRPGGHDRLRPRQPPHPRRPHCAGRLDRPRQRVRPAGARRPRARLGPLRRTALRPHGPVVDDAGQPCPAGCGRGTRRSDADRGDDTRVRRAGGLRRRPRARFSRRRRWQRPLGSRRLVPLEREPAPDRRGRERGRPHAGGTTRRGRDRARLHPLRQRAEGRPALHAGRRPHVRGGPAVQVAGPPLHRPLRHVGIRARGGHTGGGRPGRRGAGRRRRRRVGHSRQNPADRAPSGAPHGPRARHDQLDAPVGRRRRRAGAGCAGRPLCDPALVRQRRPFPRRGRPCPLQKPARRRGCSSSTP